MTEFHTISRRGLAKLALGASALPLLGVLGESAAQPRQPDLMLFMMGDVHSGYRYFPQLITTIQNVIQQNPGTTFRIMLDGDLHESGNVLSARNGAAIDLYLAQRLQALAPIIVNMGNHDSDVFDPAVFVSKMSAIGATVISNLTDKRTGNYFTAPSTSFMVGRNRVVAAGIATPSLGSYAAAYQSVYSIPDPGTWAAQNLPAALNGSGLTIVMSHSGFLNDLKIMSSLTEPFLLHGAHDHLTFSQRIDNSLHVHTGAWSNAVTVASIWFGRFGPIMSTQVMPIPGTGGDSAMASLIAAQRAQYLTATDLQVLGKLPQAMSLNDSIAFACQATAAAAGADVGFLSHTTFGDGLPAGPVTRFDFNAFIRFPGGFTLATVDAPTLTALLARANQFANYPYSQRTGDFLHAAPVITPAAGKTYKIVVNSFATSSAANQTLYLGTTGISFAPAPASLELRALVAAALPQ